LITPAASAWVDGEHLAGLAFADQHAAARRWLPVLRERERADIVIGLVHGGLNSGYDRRVAVGKGLALPNAAGLLADEAPRFDLIVSGHAHRLGPRRARNGDSAYTVPVVQPGARGEALAVARLHLRGTGGRWVVTEVAREVRYAAIAPEPAMLAEAALVLDRTSAWLREPTAVRFAGLPAREDFQRCAGALSHRASVRVGAVRGRAGKGEAGADGAANFSGGDPASSAGAAPYSLLPKVWRFVYPRAGEIGTPVRRAHLYRWMRYGNPLVLAAITPRQIALMLEPYARHVRGLNARYSIVLHPGGLVPKIAPGGTEVLSLRPEGRQAALPPHDPVPVWLTNYHWNGGGGLAARALLHPGQETGRTKVALREMVFELLSDPAAGLPPPCKTFLSGKP
jgi:2',3'-cyclic-nucleotide 2'-phosphodiesterase (5'-nucleotidase family)